MTCRQACNPPNLVCGLFLDFLLALLASCSRFALHLSSDLPDLVPKLAPKGFLITL
jgi:hypothetical protein